MKIVKLGMPSLTGQFEINTVKMETTVYDWDGKDYKPSLCATVIKGKKVPSITRHPVRHFRNEQDTPVFWQVADTVLEGKMILLKKSVWVI